LGSADGGGHAIDCTAWILESSLGLAWSGVQANVRFNPTSHLACHWNDKVAAESARNGAWNRDTLDV
jgi:hypothetical protein